MTLNLKKLDLKFDPDTRHWLNGSQVPGCTSISALFSEDGWKFAWPPKLMGEKLLACLKSGVIIGESHIKEAKNAWREKRDKSADTGTKGHEIIEYVIKQRMRGEQFPYVTHHEYEEISGEVANILDQFFLWEIETKPEWLASELQVASETHKFAGILDALARIDGKIVLIDFKTSSGIKDEYNIQLAGLCICLEEMGLPVDQRAILHLPKKGRYEYRIIDTDLEFEKECFLAGLKLYSYKNLFLARCK